jgi:hypothetical protein
MFRAVRRAAGPSALLAAFVFVAAGCDDQRGPVTPASTGVLDGESVYDVSGVLTSTFTMLNDVVERILAAYESGAPLPLTLTGCNGGSALVTDNADGDPATFRVTFNSYSTACREQVPLVIATNPDVGANMVVKIGETNPGLSYTISLPYDFATNTPGAIQVQLPSEIGFEFDLTAPFGPVTYELDRDRGTPGALLEMRGTLRWEDRANVFNIVQELALAYPMDESATPIHAQYPVGAYQIAAWASGTAGFPVNVGFEGDGVIVYRIEGTDCRGNLATGFNPCADL